MSWKESPLDLMRTLQVSLKHLPSTELTGLCTCSRMLYYAKNGDLVESGLVSCIRELTLALKA